MVDKGENHSNQKRYVTLLRVTLCDLICHRSARLGMVVVTMAACSREPRVDMRALRLVLRTDDHAGRPHGSHALLVAHGSLHWLISIVV